jgi:hypothetical protein
MKSSVLAMILFFASTSNAQELQSGSPDLFLAHSLFDMHYKCAEHTAGQLTELGDALGSDCVPEAFVVVDGRAFMRPFKSDGLSNEDWYGWNQDVLAPCQCEVISIHINPITNVPGIMGKPGASSIELRAQDGTIVTVAHIQSPVVQIGDKVNAGQVIAKVGNNRMCRNPHIHIGAHRDGKPLQLRWDLTKTKVS